MDWSEFSQYILLVLVGFASGFVNTVGGGGSLITMPILIFMGMPGTVANGTNRLAVLGQTLFAVGGFHNKGVALPVPYVHYLSLASLVGGLIGVQWAVTISDAVFNKILAGIMVLALASIWIGTPQNSSCQKREKMSTIRQILGSIIFFLLGIYGGFIQAGIGFLAMVALSQLNNFTLVRTNYIKVFVAVPYTAASVLVFAFEEKIMWTMGIVLAVGQGVGGWYASRWSVDKGDKWIKRVLLVAVIIMAVKLWFF